MNSYLGMLIDEKLNMQDEHFHQIAQKQGYDLRASSYRLLIIACTCEISDAEKYQKYCIDLPRCCREHFAQRRRRALIEHDFAGKCIVLLMDKTHREAAEEAVAGLARCLDRHQYSDTVIAVGKQVETVSQISQSYTTAMNALSYRSLYSGERCLFCEDMQAVLKLSTLQSVVDPNQMLRLFQHSDMDGLRAMVTEYAERVRALSGESIEGRHPTSIRRMFVELTVYVLHMASDMGVDVDALLSGVDPYNFLLFEEKTTPVIIDWFMDLCGKVRQAIDEKTKSKKRTVIQTVCAYINKHIMQDDLNLEDVAATVNVTPSYLSRLFHKEMEIGFSKYIVQQRMEISKTLLEKTDLPMKEIARRAGFASANYFGSVFKRNVGMSPNAYRCASRK